MTYNLFLDDERMPEDVTWMPYRRGPWEIVRTQDQFVAVMRERGIPDFISFDNDLGTGNGEGRYCAREMTEMVMAGELEMNPQFAFRVHSRNPVAAEYIHMYLNWFMELAPWRH